MYILAVGLFFVIVTFVLQREGNGGGIEVKWKESGKERGQIAATA
jgi:hypothetical protein